MNAILNHEVAPLPDTVPTDLRRLVERCLEKEPAARWQSAADLGVNLRWALGSTVSTTPPSPPRPRPWPRVITAAALAALLASLLLRPASAPNESAQFLNAPGPYTSISPNGRWLVRDTPEGIRVRDLGGTEERLLPGTKGSVSLRSGFCWSPDSRHICYFSGSALWRAGVEGEPPLRLAPAPDARGAAWSGADGGVLVYAPTPSSGLFRVPARGGQPVAVTKLDTAAGQTAHIYPDFFPDGKRILYTIRNADSKQSKVVTQLLRWKGARRSYHRVLDAGADSPQREFTLLPLLSPPR